MRRNVARLPWLVALAAAVTLTGCPDEDDPAPIGSVTVSSQDADPADQVVVDQVVSPGPGWIVIHADSAGSPGEVIGFTELETGAALDVVVELERIAIDGETLHAMLHEDGGELGTYEFPGPDVPVEDSDGNVIVASFTVNVPGQVLPSVSVDDQVADPANEVLVAEVVSVGAGFLAVHEQTDGTFGDAIGLAAVADGTTEDLVVTLGRDAIDGETLYAMLHINADGEGEYDATADVPVEDVSGAIIAPTFIVSVDAPVEVTPSVTVADQVADPANQVVVAEVVSNGPGVLVVHEDDGAGSFGDPIGNAPVDHGTTSNLVVTLDRDAVAGETLYAMLHEDGGTVGMYEPASDPPVSVDGEIVSPSFEVLAGAPTCAEYCAVVQASCVDGNAQYASEDDCVAYCEEWAMLPAGTAEDVAGNTIGCRIYHAGVAGQTEPEVHCPHAGPSGGDACGTWCENYCHLAATNCTGDQALFADDQGCLDACAGYEAGAESGATGGDSVQCRIYHLGVAGAPDQGGAETHCPHGGVDGGGVCAAPPPTCAEYCTAVMDACTNNYQQYPDEDTCLALCEGLALPGGTFDDVEGNTLGCRIYHAGVATEANPHIHCPHAGLSGGDVCGSYCDVYCYAHDQACGLYPQFEGTDCATACAGYADDGTPGDTEGDTVQCRISYLAEAIDDPGTSDEVNCPKAGPESAACTGDAPEYPTCEGYCATITANCVGDNVQYATEQECIDYCYMYGELPQGTVEDVSGNTIGCRTYHAGVAGEEEPGVHCAHAGPSGGAVCGSWCENYCWLEALNCGGFADETACMDACAGYDTDGAPGAVEGDDVQCRIYHLGVAGNPDAGGPEVHCPHGAEDGGGVCVDPTCQAYCDTVMASCTDGNAQYGSADECMAYCETYAQLPAGGNGDTNVNSIGCRIYHAGVAADTEPEVHCVHAGPSGGDQCGSWCDNYCHLAQTNCSGDQELFADTDACMDACVGYAADGEAGDAGGDSVQCRIYHLGVAGNDDEGGAEAHCAHGDIDGGGVCSEVPTCEAYCDVVTANCTGEYEQYADYATCVDYCQSWAQLPVGASTDTDGNTVGCRTYHAGVAGDDPAKGGPEVHCDHAGPTGGNSCGSWCDNYCHLAMTNCTDPALYDDDTACSDACDGFSTGGVSGDTEGDTVQCRIYHLGVAGGPAELGGPEVHCGHGGPTGDEVCVDGPTLYETLGGEAAIEAVIVDFVGRVLADSKINGYFLNNTLDDDKLVLCLVKQVSAATGSPDHTYPGPGDGPDGDGCRNMEDSHAGLGISTADFNDLVGHLVDALADAAVAQGDIDTITSVLAPLAADIVEDVDNDDTVYQRVGRKPAIESVVDQFIPLVVSDASIGGFFGTTDADRLDTCLVRQVCGIDGPCKYGFGVEEALMIGENIVPCMDMASVHAGMTNADDGSTISIDDFNALVGHLVTALDDHGVAEADKTAILDALGGLCDDIVDGGCAAPAPPNYVDDVQPIFADKCGGCHTGGGSGQHNIGTTYEDALEPSYSCAGLTKGECTIVRIQSGDMPNPPQTCTGDPAQDVGNDACLTQEQQDTLQAWIDAGMPEN